MKTGIFLVNLGTPDSANYSAVWRYLAEFLSDPDVVDLPRFLWLPLLYGIILPLRSYPVSKKYQEVLLDDKIIQDNINNFMQNFGGKEQEKAKNEANKLPLRYYTVRQAMLLSNLLQEKGLDVFCDYAMRYGKPSLLDRLKKMQSQKIEKIIVLPLYPQYSKSTTGSIAKAIKRILSDLKYYPQLEIISDYSSHPSYIEAVAKSIQDFWLQKGERNYLVFSFHGLPERYVINGDPYKQQCENTAFAVAEKLNLEKDKDWELVYQSRFGREAWLQPYCDKRLIELANSDFNKVDVVCPGFSSDCIETLEEISITNKDLFLDAGGKELRYIPALNDSSGHISMLYEIIKSYF